MIRFISGMSTKVFSTVFSFYGSTSLLLYWFYKKRFPASILTMEYRLHPADLKILGFWAGTSFVGTGSSSPSNLPPSELRRPHLLMLYLASLGWCRILTWKLNAQNGVLIEFDNILRQQCNETFLRPSCYGCRPLRGAHWSPRSFCAPYRKSFFTWQNVYIFIVSKLQKKINQKFTSKALFHFCHLQKAEAIPGRSTNFLQHILDILALVLNIRVEQVFLKIFKIPEYFFNGWQ